MNGPSVLGHSSYYTCLSAIKYASFSRFSSHFEMRLPSDDTRYCFHRSAVFKLDVTLPVHISGFFSHLELPNCKLDSLKCLEFDFDSIVSLFSKTPISWFCRFCRHEVAIVLQATSGLGPSPRKKPVALGATFHKKCPQIPNGKNL